MYKCVEEYVSRLQNLLRKAILERILALDRTLTIPGILDLPYCPVEIDLSTLNTATGTIPKIVKTCWPEAETTVPSIPKVMRNRESHGVETRS